MSGPEVPTTDMEDDVDLSDEVYTPDVYGPIEETYYFYNSGEESVRLTNGKYTDCCIIEPDEEYWNHGYEYDGHSNVDEYYYDEGYEYKSESSSYSSYPGLGFPDMADVYDFDAEIELQMGEECEPYTITSPTLVDIPAGLVHAPLIFKRVTKPVFFLEVTLELEGKYKMITPDNENK